MTERVGTVRECREGLAADLRDSATRRAAQAERHPDDARHERSADALDAATRDVATLADDDPRLARLARLADGGDHEAIDRFTDVRQRIVGQHGFGPAATQTTDELLSALVEAADDAVVWSLDLSLQDDSVPGDPPQADSEPDDSQHDD